jgi:hypothetical protein
MADVELKIHLLALARETLGQTQVEGSQLQPGRGGTATYNEARDSEILQLPSLAPAGVTALESLPQFFTAADPSQAKRVIVQFIYDFLERQKGSEFSKDAHEETWSSFWAELVETEWTYFGISYLDNFISNANLLELGDGVDHQQPLVLPVERNGLERFSDREVIRELAWQWSSCARGRGKGSKVSR